METIIRPTSVHDGWRVLALLAALFAMPGVVAAWLYFSGWHPAPTAVHGKLVLPPQPVSQMILGEADGQSVKLARFGTKWTLLYFGPADCTVACMRRLYHMRQVHLAQGAAADRVQRVFVAMGGVRSAETDGLTRIFPGLNVVSADSRGAPASALGGEGRIFLIDPMGNLIVTYAGDGDAEGMRKDLARLLAYSWVG